jgi:hypothetical protein
MNEITITDFSKFGSREREMAEDLLRAWREQGLPKDFVNDKVVIMMNINSGNVFLSNSEFQVAMLNGENLESFYSCSYCGFEGFLNEFKTDTKNKCCKDYMREIKRCLK